MDIFNAVLLTILLYLMIGILYLLYSLFWHLEDFLSGDISYNNFVGYLEKAYKIIFIWPYMLITELFEK